MWGRDLPRKINPTRLGFAASSQEIERPSKLDQAVGGKMTRPRAADDFSAIRARMEELRRERAGAQAAESELQQDQPMHRARSARCPPSEITAGPGQVRPSGSARD